METKKFNNVINNTSSSNNVQTKKQQKVKTILYTTGYIKNSKTFVDELNALLNGTGKSVTLSDINCIAALNSIQNRNKHGYPQESDGTSIAENNAQYKVLKTGLLDCEQNDIIGWFTRKRDNRFEGIKWGTEASFRKSVSIEKKFNIGDFYFDEWMDGCSFLEDIANSTIPEVWSYKHSPSGLKHPILKSYIENIFNRLKQEHANGELNKIIFSQDGKWMMFNTNLLDKFFHEIIIVAEVRHIGNKDLYFNPKRSKKETDRLKKKFDKDAKPTTPKFFENVDEVVFQTKWSVDRDFDKFTHIIEERGNRFPTEYKGKRPEILARTLDNAIDYAVTITQRNYKFIVPMYRPQKDSIQLLMPIYLEGTFQNRPDFALVLTPNPTNEIYIPETILPLDAAYQNARLIAKPDETWLNPAFI